LAASMKLSVSFQFLDLGQLAGLLGRVISSNTVRVLNEEFSTLKLAIRGTYGSNGT
jgi:hypothetical protein